MVKSYLKKLFSDLHSIILGIIVSALVLSAGGIYLFSKKLWEWLISTLKLPTPLWVTIVLVVVVVLAFIRLKIKIKKPIRFAIDKYLPKFGVLWDEDFNMRCNSCGTLLKHSSGDEPSKFFCSDRKNCDSKHVLKDENGTKLTQKEALDILKHGKKATSSDEQLSHAAIALLKIFVTKDTTEADLKQFLNDAKHPFNKIEIEAGIVELREKRIIISSQIRDRWKLTDNGKKLIAAKLSKSQV